MKKQGLADDTIKNYGKNLRFLEKHCDLDDPETIREFLARSNFEEGYKRNLVYAYERYIIHYGLQWEKPRYREGEKLPKIPLEKHIDMIISASSRRLAIELNVSKETGLRPIEVVSLRVRDIDLNNGVIYPSTAKHGSGRALKLKHKTAMLLEAYIEENDLGINNRIFPHDSDQYGKSFRYYRDKVAEKLKDPSIKSIRLYDLRHFYAAMLYHKTKDVLLVKQQMGHKKLKTTLRYTQLINFDSDEYNVKVASSLEECTKLLEAGFQYVTDYQDKKIFRKRK